MVSLKIFQPQEPTTNLRVGMRLDKFRLTRRMGQGGFATVFAATDLVEDRKVALKIPDPMYTEGEQALEDLHREVRIMARMDHPSVLPLKDARFVDGHFVMVFPLGEETLEDRLLRRLPRAEGVELTIQMVSALAHLHSKRVLHRDIKPENFVLFPGGVIQLGDFGLARIETHGYEVSASGTLGYIAPEQAMGKPTFRSDVFSLGLVLYRMFSGEIPEYPFETLPAFHKLRRGLSQDFVAIIRKSLEPTPSKRFRDAVAMSNALAKVRYPLAEKTSQAA